jgi:hypothetical protein
MLHEIVHIVLPSAAAILVGGLSGYILSNSLSQKSPSPYEVGAVLTLLVGGALGDRRFPIGDPELSTSLYLMSTVLGFVLYKYLLQRNLPHLKNFNWDQLRAPFFPWLVTSEDGPKPQDPPSK